MARRAFCSRRPRAPRWWQRCVARWRSTGIRGAGASCSAAAWRATSAGRDPLVSMPISTAATPGRRRCELGFLVRALRSARERLGFVFTADRPARVPQVEARTRAHRILLRSGERRERADVAPVRRLLELLHAGHAVLREVVGEHAFAAANARQ